MFYTLHRFHKHNYINLQKICATSLLILRVATVYECTQKQKNSKKNGRRTCRDFLVTNCLKSQRDLRACVPPRVTSCTDRRAEKIIVDDCRWKLRFVAPGSQRSRVDLPRVTTARFVVESYITEICVRTIV